MSKNKIIAGIGLLIVIVVIIYGLLSYRNSSSQSVESSDNSKAPTTASTKSYSRAGTVNNDSNESGGEVNHIGKLMEHIGL